uniref:Lipocalin n=1 Tax=Rhipicephalus appendiculatus TaxID=34631 RepID=A0A131YTG8_RHIAP
MNVVAVGVLAALSLFVLPQLIVCPFHNVVFNDLLMFLNTSSKIYIFTLNENLLNCPYYVKEFLNKTNYVFNYTSEACPPNTTTFSADLRNDTELGAPYMDIHSWKGGKNVKKHLRYYNPMENCGVFSYFENGTTHYEVHVWDIKFLILNGKKVFDTCLTVYRSYIAQLTQLTMECGHHC